jgi:hypothetical protein
MIAEYTAKQEHLALERSNKQIRDRQALQSEVLASIARQREEKKARKSLL